MILMILVGEVGKGHPALHDFRFFYLFYSAPNLQETESDVLCYRILTVMPFCFLFHDLDLSVDSIASARVAWLNQSLNGLHKLSLTQFSSNAGSCLVLAKCLSKKNLPAGH